jgi:SAM-dependent methyltransferase
VPADRALLSAITHGDRPFHNPVDPAKLDWLLEDLGLGPSDRVLDVGCGPGELLVRLAERTGAGGLGVDLAAPQIEEARRRAAARAPGSALEFAARDAEALVGAEGGFALAACLGSTHALGGPERALGLLAGFTRPGGWVLIGEGYWRREPEAPYLAAIGATADEFGDYAALLRSGEPHGLRAVKAAVADEEDWDRYEWGLIANGERHLAAHPDAPEATDVRAWVDSARARYLAPGGRDTLGFALVLFRRP